MLFIDIERLQNRLLKVCYVPATTAGLNTLLFLLLLLTVLMKQTRQAVHAIKQSILLRCLWFQCQCYETVFGIIDDIISVFIQDFDKGYAESK